MSQHFRRLGGVALAIFAVATGLQVVDAAPVVYTNQTDWTNAITAIDAGAIFGLEDFNGQPLSDFDNTNPDGLAGAPTLHTYGAGDFDIRLNDVGNGGSHSGIINSGEFNGSNAFQVRVVDDSSDFELFPGFNVQGEGAESMDWLFADPVIGFAAQWNSTLTHDGVQINVNGVEVDLGDSLPNTNLNDGDGFFGIVDMAGISSFVLVPDNLLNDPNSFEEFEIDNFRYAHAEPIPAPGAALLGILGLGMVGRIKRRLA